MIRFLARYRKPITALILFVFIGALVYLAIKSKNIRMSDYESDTYSGLAFGTSVKKTIYMDGKSNRDKINEDVDELITNLDERISCRNAYSEVSSNNKAYAVDGVTKYSEDIVKYLSRELEVCKETDGAFCPCILPLSILWGIEDGYSKPPSQSEIDEVLPLINPNDIEVVENGVIFHNNGMEIDFGAVGKGIAADIVMKELTDKNVPGAVVSIGGTIAVHGNKGKGKLWHVGIQDPRGDDGKVFGILSVAGGNVVSTSGDYEKYFMVGEKRYHHIFDPKTGYPADNGLISVTICTDDGFLSDAMSTACFVMGLDKGMEYAEEKGVVAIFVTNDKKVYLSKKAKSCFDIKADGYEIAKK